MPRNSDIKIRIEAENRTAGEFAKAAKDLRKIASQSDAVQSALSKTPNIIRQFDNSVSNLARSEKLVADTTDKLSGAIESRRTWHRKVFPK